MKSYFTRKPTICETLFFPSSECEITLTNMIRTCIKSLDICVFNITNDRFAQAILEAYDRNITIRIITDDECCKDKGSDINKFWNAVKIIFFIKFF